MSAPLVVLQSSSYWLNRTMVWLHTQVASLPPTIESHVVCDKLLYADEFPTRSVRSLGMETALWRFLARHAMRLAVWRRAQIHRSSARRHGAAILHSHFADRGWQNLAVARAGGLKHVVTFYGYDVNRLPLIEPVWRERYRELFAQADLFLCEGPHMARCLVELGCPPHKAQVHHLGIKLEQIRHVPRTLGAEPMKVLMAGTFGEKKGFVYALEALERIKDDVDIEATLIGDTDQAKNTPEKEKILAAADRLRKRGAKIRLLGYVPHATLMDEVSRHHVFLSPSVTASDGDTEGGAPVSIIEAAAAGMIVVSTTHCDIPGVVQHGVSGMLAPERDSEALAQALLWVARHPGEWARMSGAARRHVEAEFDARVQGVRLAAIYEQLARR